ncbi:tRNA (adenosine(37)-N6)-dimethylallyltransferase MiaA [endosymbiont of Pachyrhynchus infernalis]|uniref:tRNA (adenosine(37)-N6)-dimethylallyltransferase MiaA n=1 Tax=endosymbiont of Pachyrhynchus infernalis TaxID=1971488 RepID=UPI0038B65210
MNKFITNKKFNKIPILFIIGHTASGKTKLSFKLSNLFPIKLINSDSTLIFRDMNIGTSKPNKEELIKYPYKIIDIRDPIQKYSVLDFCRDSITSIYEILLCNKIPTFVGGSMFYIKTLLNGINLYSNLFINFNIKKSINDINIYKIKNLYFKLNKNNLNINNNKIIYKYIENYFLIKNNSKFIGLNNISNKLFDIYQIIIINEDKTNINKKIKFRFYKMIDDGFENEVLNLFNRGDLDYNKQSIKSIGYKQMWDYFSNKISYKDMINNSIKSTINLYKKQINWINNWKFKFKKFNTDNNSINKLIHHIKNIIKNYNYNI